MIAIDPRLAEALENLERDVSFLMALHEPSNNPVEERAVEQRPQEYRKDGYEQLRSHLIWLEEKLNEHIDKSTKKKEHYTIK